MVKVESLRDAAETFCVKQKLGGRGGGANMSKNPLEKWIFDGGKNAGGAHANGGTRADNTRIL